MATKFEKAKGDFTSFAGLKLFEQVIAAGKLKSRLRDFMPTGQRITADKSYNKFLSMIYGMIVGNDCISDMDYVTQDPIFQTLCKKTFTANNYGNFLTKFSPGQVRKINEELKRYALFLRMKAFPNDRDFILDIDSTQHKQHAKTMEGCEWGYGDHYGLTSLHVYDQHSFMYHIDVRSGATHTAKGAPNVLREVFKGVPRKLARFVRADSGYCNFGVMKACLEARSNFVICMPENMYGPLLEKRNPDWWKWNVTKDTRFRDGRLAQTVSLPYYAQGIKGGLRVVVMRAKKAQRDLFNQEIYDYRAFVTNMSKSEMEDEEVIEFYKKRGNSENFIKENKNAFDMHHFPSRKLLANNVWGLITAFAFNTMRFQARVLNSKTMHYAKKIRFRMIYLGAHVVKKARYWIIRLNPHHHEEVLRFQNRIQHLLTG